MSKRGLMTEMMQDSYASNIDVVNSTFLSSSCTIVYSICISLIYEVSDESDFFVYFLLLSSSLFSSSDSVSTLD